jgi:predicted acylesterase/phospholipase RssA
MRYGKVVAAAVLSILPVSAHCQSLPSLPLTKAVDAAGKAPFSLAISGGISLGSYEAGMNWAYLRYLKNRSLDTSSEPPVMASVAGASAGGINALFSAISWCLDDAKASGFRFDPKPEPAMVKSLCQQESDSRQDSGATGNNRFGNDIQHNLFRRMWLGVDFDTLVPKDRNRYDKTDGLLSRCAFEPVLNDLDQVVNAPIFREGCSVPVGIILTREKVELEGAGPLAAPNDRFVLTLLAKSYPAEGGYKLRFEPYIADANKAELGNSIILPVAMRNGVYESPFEDVKRAIEASSAFPFAFGPLDLRYCLQKMGGAGGSDCPQGYELKFGEEGRFVDGGVFDNIPLGTAKALAEPYRFEEVKLPNACPLEKTGEESGKTKSPGNYTYIYMDPDHQRQGALPESSKKENEQEKSSYGIFGGAGFLSGAFNSARKHELYDQLRSGIFSHQSKVVTRIMTQRVTEQFKVETLPDVSVADCAATAELTASSAPTVVACMKRGQDNINNTLAARAGTHAIDATASLQDLRRHQFDYLQKVAAWLCDESLMSRLLTARNDRFGERRALISSRYAPITGNYFGAFGAFIDKDFRTYDYYVGVYDAIENLAADTCPPPPEEVKGQGVKGAATSATDPAEAPVQACLQQKMQQIAKDLGVFADPDAAPVFGILARREFRWGETAAGGSANVRILAETFTDDTLQAAPSFRQLVKKLQVTPEFQPQGEMLKQIMKMRSDSDYEMLEPLASRLLARARDEEIVESEYNDKAKLWHAVPFLNLIVARALGNTERFVPNRGHAADKLWTLLPWEVSTDLVNGGANMSWEPRYLLSPNYSINPKLTVGLDKFSGDRTWYGGLDAYLAYRSSFFGLGAGPGISRPFRKEPGYSGVGFGISGFVEILDALRVTVGTRSVDRGDYYFLFGFTDIPGRMEAIFKSLFR